VSESAKVVADVHASQLGWSQHELANLRHAETRLLADGLSLETDCGITDEGEPWFVFCEANSGEVIAHFARIDGKYVVCVPFRDGAVTGWFLRELVDQFMQRHMDARLSIRISSPPAA
jgi:hypothetical protein